MKLLSSYERQKLESFVLRNTHDDFVNRETRHIMTPFYYKCTSVSKISDLPELVLFTMVKRGKLAHLRDAITSDFIKYSFKLIFKVKKFKQIEKELYPSFSFRNSIIVCGKSIYYRFANSGEIEFFISKKHLH